MMLALFVRTLIALLFLTPASAEIYLITGTPSSRSPTPFAVDLLHVRNDGQLTTTVNLIAEDEGLYWLGIAYDWRKVVMLTAKNHSVILDLDKLSITKRCHLPNAKGSLIEQWLADVPSRGPSFVWYDINEENKGFLRDMALDPEISCEASFSDADPTVINHLRAHGGAGVADDFWSEGTYIGLAKGNRLVKRLCGTVVSLDLQIPSELLQDVDYVNGIAASNAEIVVLNEANKKGMRRAIVFRRHDNSWRQIPDTRNAAYVRAFGHFISFSDGWQRTRPEEESAGSAEWRKRVTRSGQDVSYKFKNSTVIQPGRLHIFDAESETSYVIETNQGDSEVLLIENGTIYYRVSDRLYSVAIKSTGLSAPELLAKDEALRDAHWAFLSSSPASIR